MTTPATQRKKAGFRLGSILLARCPACHEGPVLKGVMNVHPRCSVCGYDYYPESGFYLGAMAVASLLTAMLTVPPMVILKLLEVDIRLLLIYPFVQFLVLGTFLIIYAKVLWLHLEYRMTDRLDGQPLNSNDPSTKSR